MVKSKGVALVLCIFLGYIGVHRFYVGKTLSGVLYVFTFGLAGIGWLYDIYAIATDRFLPMATPRREAPPLRFPVSPQTGMPSPPPAVNATQAYNHERSLLKGRAVLPDSTPGFVLSHDYSDVNLAMAQNHDKIGIGSIVTLKHEPANAYDNNAVVAFVGDIKIGYLYKGKLQDMFHDFINRGDYVAAVVEAFVEGKKNKGDDIRLLLGFYKQA